MASFYVIPNIDTFNDNSLEYELKFMIPSTPNPNTLKIRFQRNTSPTGYFRDIYLNTNLITPNEEKKILIKTTSLDFDSTLVERLDLPSGVHAQSTYDEDAKIEDDKNIVVTFPLYDYYSPKNELFNGEYTLSISYTEQGTETFQEHVYENAMTVLVSYIVMFPRDPFQRRKTANSILYNTDIQEPNKKIFENTIRGYIYIRPLPQDYQLVSQSARITYESQTDENEEPKIVRFTSDPTTGSIRSFLTYINNLLGTSSTFFTSISGGTVLSHTADYKVTFSYQIHNPNTLDTQIITVQLPNLLEIRFNISTITTMPPVITSPLQNGLFFSNRLIIQWNFPDGPSLKETLPSQLIITNGGQTTTITFEPFQIIEGKNIANTTGNIEWDLKTQENLVTKYPGIIKSVTGNTALVSSNLTFLFQYQGIPGTSIDGYSTSYASTQITNVNTSFTTPVSLSLGNHYHASDGNGSYRVFNSTYPTLNFILDIFINPGDPPAELKLENFVNQVLDTENPIIFYLLQNEPIQNYSISIDPNNLINEEKWTLSEGSPTSITDGKYQISLKFLDNTTSTLEFFLHLESVPITVISPVSGTNIRNDLVIELIRNTPYYATFSAEFEMTQSPSPDIPLAPKTVLSGFRGPLRTPDAPSTQVNIFYNPWNLDDGHSVISGPSQLLPGSVYSYTFKYTDFLSNEQLSLTITDLVFDYAYIRPNFSSPITSQDDIMAFTYFVLTQPNNGTLKVKFQRLNDNTDFFRDLLLNDISQLGVDRTFQVKTNLNDNIGVQGVLYPSEDLFNTETEAKEQDDKNLISGYYVPFLELYNGTYQVIISYLESGNERKVICSENIIIDIPLFHPNFSYYGGRLPTLQSIEYDINKKVISRIWNNPDRKESITYYIKDQPIGDLKIIFKNKTLVNEPDIEYVFDEITVGSSVTDYQFEIPSTLLDHCEYEMIFSDNNNILYTVPYYLKTIFSPQIPPTLEYPESGSYFIGNGLPLKWKLNEFPSLQNHPRLKIINDENKVRFIQLKTIKEDEGKNVFVDEPDNIIHWSNFENKLSDIYPDYFISDNGTPLDVNKTYNISLEFVNLVNSTHTDINDEELVYLSSTPEKSILFENEFKHPQFLNTFSGEYGVSGMPSIIPIQIQFFQNIVVGEPIKLIFENDSKNYILVLNRTQEGIFDLEINIDSLTSNEDWILESNVGNSLEIGKYNVYFEHFENDDRQTIFVKIENKTIPPTILNTSEIPKVLKQNENLILNFEIPQKIMPNSLFITFFSENDPLKTISLPIEEKKEGLYNIEINPNNLKQQNNQNKTNRNYLLDNIEYQYWIEYRNFIESPPSKTEIQTILLQRSAYQLFNVIEPINNQDISGTNLQIKFYLPEPADIIKIRLEDSTNYIEFKYSKDLNIVGEKIITINTTNIPNSENITIIDGNLNQLIENSTYSLYITYKDIYENPEIQKDITGLTFFLKKKSFPIWAIILISVLGFFIILGIILYFTYFRHKKFSWFKKKKT